MEKKVKMISNAYTLNFIENLDKEKYSDFTKQDYPYGLNFFDFEVFSNSNPKSADWGVVILNPLELTRTIIINDRKSLYDYYIKHAKQIWCGYNNARYDNPMLIGILQGLNAGFINNGLIVEQKSPYDLGIKMNEYPLYGYDCMFSRNLGSLKLLEGYMGLNIEETSVPFDIDRRLTKEEWDKTIFYCKHDVDSTIEVFRNSKDEYVAKVSLCENFNIPFEQIGKTKAQLSASILQATQPSEPRKDSWDLQIIPQIELNEFKWVKDWFMNPRNYNPFSFIDNVDVYGTKAKIGWGGIHSALPQYNCEKGIFYHVDVTSYYPSLMIKHSLLSRNCANPNKYEEIFKERVKAKRDGRKAYQMALKIVLNSTFGASGDKFNGLFDERQQKSICVNGQLGLLDLCEHLKNALGNDCTIIQTNTDGIILKLEKEENVFIMNEVCDEWSNRLSLGLDRDKLVKINQRDVNNYMFVFENGKIERKGCIKDLSPLSYDCPIVTKAIVDYLLNGTKIEDYMNNCDDMIEYQILYKVTANYEYAFHNGKKLYNKTYRVFASKNATDTPLYKKHKTKTKVDKFASTPLHCFIENGDIRGKKIPSNLDKHYYIDEAHKIIESFGISSRESIFDMF